LRNFTATANHLAGAAGRVALIGAGTRGQARPEDQMVCAWIGQRLLERGFEVENDSTLKEVEAWREADPKVITSSPSADYLRETQQTQDIDFVLEHVDDIDGIALYNGQQVTLLLSPEQERPGLALQAT
jgi:2-phosphosulfolactate phosphatase